MLFPVFSCISSFSFSSSFSPSFYAHMHTHAHTAHAGTYTLTFQCPEDVANAAREQPAIRKGFGPTLDGESLTRARLEERRGGNKKREKNDKKEEGKEHTWVYELPSFSNFVSLSPPSHVYLAVGKDGAVVSLEKAIADRLPHRTEDIFLRCFLAKELERRRGGRIGK